MAPVDATGEKGPRELLGDKTVREATYRARIQYGKGPDEPRRDEAAWGLSNSKTAVRPRRIVDWNPPPPE